MRKAVSFNPHWVDGDPAWDIALSDQKCTILRSVTKTMIRISISSDCYLDVVRECDIQEYAKNQKSLITQTIKQVI